jgi:hypothetical protein
VERRDGRGEKWGQCTIEPVKRAWLALGGSLGLSALWRRRTRQRPPDDPAEELRAKLAQSRATAATAVEEAPAVPVPDEAVEPIAQPEEASPLDPEVRRRSVHDRTRASMEELGSDG